MLPVQDNTVRHYPAVASWTLIVWNVVVFLYQVSLSPSETERFLIVFSLIPARYFGELAALVPPTGFIDYLPFISNIFLHGGWLHLILNMWMLWIFGRAVEQQFGLARFVGFYFVVGVAASLTHAVINASSEVPTLGASGAIAGLIGCYVRMFPFARLAVLIPIPFLPLFFEVHAIAFAVFWLVTQVVPAVTSIIMPSEGGGVAWWAHIGGFAFGWLLTPLLRPPVRTVG